MNKLHVTAEPGRLDCIMTREFDAPRELVFRAHTDPALVQRWWAPEGMTIDIDKLDARSGGEWRFVQRGQNGEEYAFHGVYHEVKVPERIIWTFEFEPMPGHVLLETMTFEEHEGKTLLKSVSVYQTVEDRDGMIASGMESGAASSLNRLEALLKEL
jgi:uncharacterized protein YndB with AHSA1/START domain